MLVMQYLHIKLGCEPDKELRLLVFQHSPAFTLSALNNLGDDGSDEKIQQFAQTVATHVVDTMLNPVYLPLKYFKKRNDELFVLFHYTFLNIFLWFLLQYQTQK